MCEFTCNFYQLHYQSNAQTNEGGNSNLSGNLFSVFLFISFYRICVYSQPTRLSAYPECFFSLFHSTSSGARLAAVPAINTRQRDLPPHHVSAVPTGIYGLPACAASTQETLHYAGQSCSA